MMVDKDEGSPIGQDPMRLCYVCRMPISVLAIRCRYCGAEVGRPRKEQETYTIADLGGEKVGTYTVSGNVTDALESFMMEERAQLEAAAATRVEDALAEQLGRQDAEKLVKLLARAAKLLDVKKPSALS